MKKLMILTMAAILSALPLAADTETVNGITWNYTVIGGKATINSEEIPISTTGEITVPSTLGGYPVTSIGDYVFWRCSGLTSVTIPNGVTSIGNSAFSGCSGLTSVTIPDGVTRIGYYAFKGCSWLTSVTIPSSVTSIGSDAFYNCSRLTSVHIADLAAWCRIPFANSTANPLNYAHNLYLNGVLITNLTIPSGVTSIWQYAFQGCSSLTSVTIPNGVTRIGTSAFQNCSRLTSVTIPASVTDLSTTAFDGCGKLWTAWYRTLANSAASGGGSVPGADPRYALSSVAADRAVASVTVDGDTAIDSFVLTDGKVYDTALYVVNSSASEVHLSLPGGYVYVTPKGKTPLAIPANSMNLLTITRLAERTFLVTRQLLEIVK